MWLTEFFYYFSVRVVLPSYKSHGSSVGGFLPKCTFWMQWRCRWGGANDVDSLLACEIEPVDRDYLVPLELL
jgi:hypothetical protein